MVAWGREGEGGSRGGWGGGWGSRTEGPHGQGGVWGEGDAHSPDCAVGLTGVNCTLSRVPFILDVFHGQ